MVTVKYARPTQPLCDLLFGQEVVTIIPTLSRQALPSRFDVPFAGGEVRDG